MWISLGIWRRASLSNSGQRTGARGHREGQVIQIRKKLILAALAVYVSASLARGQAPATSVTPILKQRVAFRSDGLALVGYLFKPEGAGPFPAVIWNHGSERAPAKGRQFDSAAAVFRRAGYVLFAPVRRGHSGSQGAYIVDEIDSARRTGGPQEANRLVVRKLETEQLDDQLAGLAYLRSLPFIDTSRIVVAGCSYGGIQTLLGAERGAGYRAAIAISPAALSWQGNPLLRTRLLEAVRKIEIPVMLLQPPKDASLEPSRVLGAEFRRLGKPFSGKIYPPGGPEDEQRHCFGGAKGMHIWADDALAFLNHTLR
jgi:carboxymethylenebutenolidase